MKRRQKVCSLCFKPINNNDTYNKFKHNTVIVDKYKEDKWFCWSTHYICSSCTKKLQAYCQEGMYEEKSEE